MVQDQGVVGAVRGGPTCGCVGSEEGLRCCGCGCGGGLGGECKGDMGVAEGFEDIVDSVVGCGGYECGLGVRVFGRLAFELGSMSICISFVRSVMLGNPW